MKCQICGFEGKGKEFTKHLKLKHGLKNKEYTKKYIYCNRIECAICGEDTKYTYFKFKKYCQSCIEKLKEKEDNINADTVE
jgi:hypothetical protein